MNKLDNCPVEVSGAQRRRAPLVGSPGMPSDWRTAPKPDGWFHVPICEALTMPQGQVDPRIEPYRSMVLVAPDHIESATGRLLGKVTAAEQGAISGKYLFAPGDTLYSKIRPYLRKAVFADFTGLTSADMYPLRPVDVVAPRFLTAVVLAEHFSRFAEIVSMRSGFPKINRTEFSEYTAALPPLSEQRQIAEVLGTLDEAIRKTEETIAKLERVKQGLLHDLLTRGIDDNGELRDPDRHPEQFKDSSLGRIPKGWEVRQLGRYLADCGGFLQTGPFGSQLHSYEYSAHGVPVVMPQDISDVGVSGESVARIPMQVAKRLGRHRMRTNDLLFARRGDLSRCAPIGSREEEWICGTGCLLARLPAQALDAEWLAAAYRHDAVQRQVAGRAVGSTMVNLNTGILQSLHLAVPSWSEQHAVSTVARTHDLRTAEENAFLGKLRLTKQGLTEDLLTGRVRVTSRLGEVAK